MSLRAQVLVWIGFFLALFLVIWLFRGILLPFIVGAALAYLLNPIVTRIAGIGIGRGWATALTLLFVIAIILSLVLMLVPLFWTQVLSLIQLLPSYVANLQELAQELIPQLTQWLGEQRTAQLSASLADLLGTVVGFIGALTADLLASGLGIISIFAFVIFTPVVAFYMLLDWQKMVQGLHALLPRPHETEIRGILAEIDRSMTGVIRGQGGVILILAAFYATGLTLVGLNFGLAIGLIAGLMSFVPYVGFAIGLVLSLGVALVQFGLGWMVVLVLAVYMVGQFLEGNILYPKLVGSSININPVWLMFALLASGLLFGFVGLLLAVPLAAILGVLVRYGVRKYKDSTLYRGQSGDDDSQSTLF